MRYTMAIVFGVAVFVLSMFCVVYAQDVNHFCKTECLQKAGTLDKCNALCSTTSETGAKTKDTMCISSCMGKSNQTAYSCYSACDVTGSTSGGAGENAPQAVPNPGTRPMH